MYAKTISALDRETVLISDIHMVSGILSKVSIGPVYILASSVYFQLLVRLFFPC